MTTLISSINNLFYGLKYVVYNNYMSDNPNFFSSASLLPIGTSGTSGNNNQGIVTQIPNIIIGTNNFIQNSITENFSIQWLGYFKSNYTGLWTFYTSSDDCSYIWIGSTAITGYTVGNSVVNNGGLHASLEASGTIYLVSNQYYPIRIQFGEASGGNEMTVSFSNPNLIKTSIGNEYYFYQNNGILRP